MGIEFNLLKELANVSLTVTELTSVARVIKAHVRNPEFLEVFERLLGELGVAYDVLLEAFEPLLALDGEAAFVEGFDACHAHYKGAYLALASKPRPCAERAYEAYLQLKTLKESQTGYPLLKRTFTRLDELVDKWVTNDAWLVMSIDGALKKTSRLLDEVAELKPRDAEDAWLILGPALTDLALHLASLRNRRGELGEPPTADAEAPRWMNALLG